MKRPSVRLAAILPLLFLLALALPARAQGELDVDVELVIAVDISLSMDTEEQQLQRAGYVAAFLDPRVLGAIASGLHGRIAVAMIEWAGVETQQVVVDWMLVDGPDSAAAFSGLLAARPLTRARRTSISAAIAGAARMFEANGYRGLKRVIDVSGDGPNNQGLSVTVARDRAVGEGIVINGLPFLSRPGGGMSLFDIPALDAYYVDCVIGGPGAFSLPIDDPSEFAEAIRNKLVLEIAGPVPRRVAAPGTSDCLIGERLWRERMFNSP